MRITDRIFFSVILFFLIFTGCAPDLPKSEYPLVIQRVFHTSFDRTWDTIIEVVRISKGTIITKDKSSGLIVYSIFDNDLKSQIYMNVYLKSSHSAHGTVVYLVPIPKTGYLKGVEREFFEKLEKNLR